MALVLKDRVRESSTTSGTGSITLAGAFTGYQTFDSAVASGSTVYYTIHNTTSPNDNEWEVGVGTFTSPSTLSRDTVFSSSAGGTTKVSFSGSSTLEVFITQPAEQAVYINEATGFVEAFGNGTNTISFTDINTSNLTANTVTLTAGTISTNAANATDIVNKQYVDGIVAAGVHYHAPVLVESPTALNATYNQPGGAGNGVGATLTNAGANVALVIDGVTLSNTARVLVYTQANAVHNGVYTVTNPGNVSAQWVLTRATDADTYVIDSPTGLSEGSTFFVQSGDTGAGETYTCNTTGVITFGSTNITFAQISSAQIYSAGTGLSLTNTTFSISNTAVTAAQYGNDGNVAQITVNAQGQLTNAANVAINASSITVGTLANARTTASDANGASTIVARDSTGSFNANTITATTVNATSGNFTNVSGNGSALTAINASNISSGTIANARTTASTSNSASTIVARDANGSFGANIISASFSGDGSAITGINASNISSGTIANARTTAASANGASTIVQRDSGGNFSANTVTAAVIGDLSGGSAINASNISSGTIANARTTASSSNGASTIVLRGASGEFAAGAITGTLFTGNGSAISAINASNISTGTIDNARTSAASANGASTIVARDAGGNFSANTITATTFSGAFSGNGATISAINASNISTGTIANARTTAATANGASTIVLRGTSGEFSAGAITGAFFIGDGSNVSAINGSNVTTGTVANARTTASDANGASTIVSRDAGGNFAAATITATTFSGAFSGNGSAISAINASNISTGTIANARTTASDANGASTIVARDANGSFTANIITANGSAISAINGSNVTTGTVANARTTAASANGASTIVARDANGSFAGNVGTFNGVTVGTTNSSFDTNVLFVDATNNRIGIGTATPNYSAQIVGTYASPELLVGYSGGGDNGLFFHAQGTTTHTNWCIGQQKNVSGLEFTPSTAVGGTTFSTPAMVILSTGNVGIGKTIPATILDVNGTATATLFSGNGSALSAINASNISTGTIANARTSAATANGASTIVLRGTSGEFSAGAITGAFFIGDGSNVSAINGSNVTTGTVANARTTASDANGASTIVSRNASGSFAANIITAGSGSNTAPSITTAGDTNTGIYFPAADTVGFAEGGAGYVVGYRNIPQSGSDKTTSYTLATSDIGEFVGVGAGGSITIPNSTFSAGDVVSIFNNTTGNITITCSITTAYIAGFDSDKATMALSTRGIATVLFISGTVCVVSGNVS